MPRPVHLAALKALAVDVERNLRAPLAGIARVAAERGDAFIVARHRYPHRRYAVGRARALPARPGRHPHHDTRIALPAPDIERARRASRRRHDHRRRDSRTGPDQARRAPGAVARAARRAVRPRAAQRIGLSATQRPLEEVARFLGGARRQSRRHKSQVASHESAIASREGDGRRGRRSGRRAGDRRGFAETHGRSEIAATIVDTGATKRLKLRIVPVTIIDAGNGEPTAVRAPCGSSVPVERSRLRVAPTAADDIPSGPASVGDARPSIWSAIHPRLLELIRAHQSTLIFVNSRRLAETARRALERTCGRSARSVAPRFHRARTADGHRGPSQVGHPARAGRHLVARTRHRHGRDRPGRADRGAAVSRERAPAHRPRRTPDRCDQRRGDLPEVPRRPRRLRRGRQGHARRRGGGDALPAQPARRRGTADRRDDRDG